MGTGFDVSLGQHEQGIIPRAVHQLFQGIQSRRLRAQEAGVQPPEFKVSAQFLEVGAAPAPGQCAWVQWDGCWYILTLTRWDGTKRGGDQPAVGQTGSDSVMTDGQECVPCIMSAITSDIIAHHCIGGDG